jgi:hypothetical protein
LFFSPLTTPPAIHGICARSTLDASDRLACAVL